jgi:transcription elongation factor Elf1
MRDRSAMIEIAIALQDAAREATTPCPKCGDVQVQLVDWSTTPTKWKCRVCKHKFEIEVGECSGP